jgi:hypothetical protein
MIRMASALATLSLCTSMAFAQVRPQGEYQPLTDASAAVMTLGDSGKVSFRAGGNVLLEGVYEVRADTLIFGDRTGPIACATRTIGRYLWSFKDSTLRCVFISDEFPERRDALSQSRITVE